MTVFHHKVTKDTKVTKFFPARSLIFLALLCLFYSAPSYAADCTNPAGTESALFYSSTQNVPMYCNGSHWVAMGQLNPAAGGSGCATVGYGIKPEGYMFYNLDHHVMQYCDGDDWRGVQGGSVYGLPGPAGCSAIGDACPDTTIFAGFHLTTHEHLFIPPTDQGTIMQWKNAIGTNDINPDSFVDGRINHANRSGAIADFPAFKACEDLTLAGKSWYLPSRAELDYLYNNRAAYLAKAPGNGFTNFQDAYYWSSTEYNANGSWRLTFTDGVFNYTNKAGSYRVRCVGR